MDERRLRVFQAVADLRNFSRAAEALHMSQPTVSQQIHRLEQILDVRLFDRTSKSVTLTAAGRALYARTGSLLEQIAEMKRAVIEAEGRILGPLVLGASMTVGQYVLPQAIARFVQRHPDVTVQLRIDNTEHIAQHVLSGDLDLGLVEGAVFGNDLVEEVFLHDEVVFIAPPDHPWQAKQTITLDDVRHERLIVREEGSGTRLLLEDRLRQAGIRLHHLTIVTEMGGTEPIKSAVEAGMGVAAISARAIQKERRLGTLLVRTIPGMPMKRTFRIIRRQGRTLVPAALAFRQALSELNQENKNEAVDDATT